MFSRTTPKIASSKKTAARPNIALFETLEQRQLMSGSTEIAAEYAHTASETDAYGVNVHALLGTPTSPIMNVPGVSGALVQKFHDNGAIYWSASTGAHVMYGAIGAEYNTTALETDAYGTNVQKIIGLPTSDEVNTSIAAGGRVNHLSNGVIFWSPSTGAHVLYGAIRAEYQATASETDAYGQNVQKLIGLPTSDEANSPIAAGARLNHFSHGTIYWSGATGAHVVFGAIGAEYNHLASETDAYGQNVQKIVGLPTSDELTVPGVSGARKNSFQHGNIFWSPTTGAHVTYGAIGSIYNSLGGPSGPLGLPTNDEFTDFLGFRAQTYQHGYELWSADTGVHVYL